jgi:hypothetical protein
LEARVQATPAGQNSNEAKRRLRLYGPYSLVEEPRFAALVSFAPLFREPAGPVANAAPVVAPDAPFAVSGVALAAALPIFNPDHGHTAG